jgi:hypothetical protein
MSRAAFLCLAVVCALRASAAEPAQIQAVRYGSHPGYERVVIELDRAVDVAWERGPEPNADTFYVAAEPPPKRRVLNTKLPSLGRIALAAIRGGTQLSLEARERRVRVYWLTDPPRLVIDATTPGDEPFKAPRGVRAIEPATSIGPLQTGPEPEPEAKPEPPSETQAPPAPPATEPPVPPPSVSEPETPAPVPPSETQAPPAPPAEVTPEANEVPPPPAPPAPPIAEPPATPAPAPVTRPAPHPPRAPESDSDPLLWVGSGLLLAALLLGVLLLVRRRSSAPPPPPPRRDVSRVPISDLTPAEIAYAADQANALEKRVDEEVRARVALEQRLVEAGEEIKVLRDKLSRVERRRDEAS